jgi:tRNA(fMet)-specific endonuclease VapC
MRAGHPGVVGAIARAPIVQIPVIVLGELHAGFSLGRRAKENEMVLTEFLQEPFVSVLDITAGVSRRYGELFATLRRAGTPVPVNDIWIAAATLASGAHLLTFDRDFERFPGLDHTVLGA